MPAEQARSPASGVRSRTAKQGAGAQVTMAVLKFYFLSSTEENKKTQAPFNHPK
jgi:hypothetical protein